MKSKLLISPEIKDLLDEWCQLQSRLVHPPETTEEKQDIIRVKEIHLNLKNMGFFSHGYSERILAEHRQNKGKFI